MTASAAHLLLHDVGLDFIGFISLRFLPVDGFQIRGLLDFQIALRFGLLGQRERLGKHALLIGLRFRDG